MEVLSHKDTVYRYLTEQISGQFYMDGDMLNERRIAEELHVSRTPVREAVQLLVAEGWVTVSAHRGIFVCGLTSAQVDEIFQIRTSLEVLSVGLMMHNLTEEMPEALYSILQQQKDCALQRDAVGFIRMDRMLHNQIALFSGNRMLADLLVKLNERLTRIGRQSIQDSARYGRSLREHEKLLQAVRAGNRRPAENAMRTHIERTWRNLRMQLAKKEYESKGGETS